MLTKQSSRTPPFSATVDWPELPSDLAHDKMAKWYEDLKRSMNKTITELADQIDNLKRTI